MRATCYFQSQLFQHILSDRFCLLIKTPSSDSLAGLESDSGSLTTLGLDVGFFYYFFK